VRHERLDAFAEVLPYLDGEHLRLGHLTVQEFDDPAKLDGDLISDEHEPQPPGSEVRADPRPVLVDLRLRG
jgi:hypothetical protein